MTFGPDIWHDGSLDTISVKFEGQGHRSKFTVTWDARLWLTLMTYRLLLQTFVAQPCCGTFVARLSWAIYPNLNSKLL